MERLKDMFYNKNDIFLALVILLVAGFVIADRVEAIMDYPQALALEQDQANPEPTVTESANQTEEPTTDVAAKPEETPAADSPAQEASVPQPDQIVQISIEIPSGSTEATAAKILLDKGLIQDKASFIKALETAGKVGKVQAGTFLLPSNATMDQIIDRLTN